MSTREHRRRTGAQALVDSLVAHDVDTVFGIPGIQLDPLYDAFFEQSNQLRVIHTRHEQGAAFMAMGYAQASGRSGVFAVVPGPGLLNAMAAVSTARTANLPVLGLTGQIPSYQIGLGYGMAHELEDQLGMARGVVDHAVRAEHPAQVPELMQATFKAMHGGRPAPAVFEMAPDVLAASALVADASIGGSPRERGWGCPMLPDADAVQRAVDLVGRARRPAIFVGGGIFDAVEPLRRLAERLNAPVVMSPNGGGALPADHPLALGMIAGQQIWPDIDLALVIGTRFMSPALAWGREGELPVIRIDADPMQIVKPRPPQVAIASDACIGIEAILEALGDGQLGSSEHAERVAEIKRETERTFATLQPQADLARAIRSALPRDGIVAVDVTQMASFVRYGGFPIYAPRSLLAPGYQATLGFALPAALGAKVAQPDRKVIALCGDGGFMFTMQELSTAVHHRIPVVVIVFDNASFGNVKTIQKNSYGGRHIAVDLSNPDFAAMAQTFGMHGERAETPAALESALTRCLALDGPALIQVPIGEVPSIWKLVKRPPSQGQTRG
ncbi:MAG: hypothetical protein KDK91_15535 [Gammaproteobacteria bacterium]|nr:hypothetical protein [Gammaproteobacteria bacterium]